MAGAVLGLTSGVGLGLALDSVTGGVLLGLTIGVGLVLVFADLDG